MILGMVALCLFVFIALLEPLASLVILVSMATAMVFVWAVENL